MPSNKVQYIREYNKENCKTLLISINKKYETDILDWLSHQENKTGAIKKLIRQQIAQEHRQE